MLMLEHVKKSSLFGDTHIFYLFVIFLDTLHYCIYYDKGDLLINTYFSMHSLSSTTYGKLIIGCFSFYLNFLELRYLLSQSLSCDQKTTISHISALIELQYLSSEFSHFHFFPTRNIGFPHPL